MSTAFKRDLKELFLYFLITTAMLANISAFADDKVLGNRELLLARNVTLQRPVWCGDNKFLSIDKDANLLEIDVSNNKRKLIKNPHNVTLETCTPDGEWLIYRNKHTTRWDKGSYKSVVVDFWRYNLNTAERKKFAIAEDSETELSPDGSKLFFNGYKPQAFVEQPEPKWKLLWSAGKWESGVFREARWFNNSFSLLILGKDKLFIEIPEKSLIRQFNVDLGMITNLQIDSSERIYILASSKPPKMLAKFIKNRLLRCSATDEALRCDYVLQRDNGIIRYAITPDGGKVVFIEDGKTSINDTCIWLFEERTNAIQCITQSANINSSLSISHDGRWVTYTRSREIKKGAHTHDLYAINLITE